MSQAGFVPEAAPRSGAACRGRWGWGLDHPRDVYPYNTIFLVLWTGRCCCATWAYSSQIHQNAPEAFGALAGRRKLWVGAEDMRNEDLWHSWREIPSRAP